MAERASFLPQLLALRAAAHDSGLDVSELALTSIADSVAAEGVPSVADLRKRYVWIPPGATAVQPLTWAGSHRRDAAQPRRRFATVRASVSRAAYVPPEGGMWANLLSSALSTVSVKPSGYVDGTDVEGARLGRGSPCVLVKG